MVARVGNLPWGRQNFFTFFQDFADEDGRSLGQSPEQRQRTKLSPQVYVQGTRLQNPRSYLNYSPGWGRNGSTVLGKRTVDTPIGARTETLPITVNLAYAQRHSRGQSYVAGRTRTGRWENLGTAPRDGTTFGFDYWEKILLDPDFVDLGNVVGDTEITATIQNTFRRDNKSVTAIDNNAGAGITVTGATPPTNLVSFSNKIYVVNISQLGPPNIDGTIDWTVSTGVLTLTLTGTRIIIFPYPPQSSVNEELNWLTDIIRSADGTEQRHSLRVNPRQSIDYEIFSLNQSDVNNIRNLMIDWTTRVFGVPIWWNEISLAADVTASDLIINVRPGSLDTADFRIGGLAMIYQEDENGNRTIDSLQIADIGNSNASPESEQNQITFATPIQNNYDGSLATVVPIYAGVLTEGMKVKNHKIGDTAIHMMKFDIVDNLSSIRGVEPGDYPELEDFEGRPTLILDDTIFITGDSFTEQYSQKAQRVDFKTGPFFQLTQELRARRTTPFKWVVEDEAFHWQLRALFYYLRGKWKSVWLPTWRQDFEVKSNIGSGSAEIDVVAEGFAKYVAGNRPYFGIRLLQTNGTISYHRITDTSEVDATTDRISIDPVTPNAILIEEVERMDMMILSRLTDDKLKFLHSWIDPESDETDVEIETTFIGDLQG